MKKLLVFSVMVLLSLVDAKHVYIRHKRAIEREGDALPSKESTVVVEGNTTEHVDKSVKDFENEITTNEKDCKDFVEFDYNPVNDSLLFSGRIPTLFHNPHMGSLEKLFQRIFANSHQMFQDFPSMNNYPDNYNGTTESEILINGRRFKKKQHIINKTTDGSKISLMSTVYEPIDDETSVNGTTLAPPSSNKKDTVTEGEIIAY